MNDWDPMLRGMAFFLLVGAVSWLAWMLRVNRESPQSGPLGRLRSTLLGGPGMMRCRQSVRLTPQHSLHLIEFGRQQFLLACHPGGATLLPRELGKEACAEPGAAA